MATDQPENAIQFPISYGEAYDRLTILQIKVECLSNEAAVEIVRQEAAMLEQRLKAQLVEQTPEEIIEIDEDGVVHAVGRSPTGLKSTVLRELVQDLSTVNRKLWDTEDSLREIERLGILEGMINALAHGTLSGPVINKTHLTRFVSLARSVYFLNDERSALKRKINELLGSDMLEVKSYVKYS